MELVKESFNVAELSGCIDSSSRELQSEPNHLSKEDEVAE
jgi:hypothetical protein